MTCDLYFVPVPETDLGWNKLTQRFNLTFNISTIYGLIIDSHNDQLPVGLIAQLLEHCTGIAEVSVRCPIQAFLSLPHNKTAQIIYIQISSWNVEKSLRPGETYCTVIKCGHLGDWRFEKDCCFIDCHFDNVCGSHLHSHDSLFPDCQNRTVPLNTLTQIIRFYCIPLILL